MLAALLAGVCPASAQTAKKGSSPTPKPAASAAPSPAFALYVLPDTVATLDGEPIKKKEVESLTALLAAQGGKALQDLPTAEQKKAYESVLNNILVDRLVSKGAAAEPVSDIDVEKRYAEMISQYHDPQAFDDQVKKSGKTTDEIKANVRRQLAQQNWLERQVADDIKVTPDEVQKFYKESPPATFDAPELVRARHILVKARKDAPPEDAYEAEQKINALAERIKKGEPFEQVAKDPSNDPAARQNDGDLGYFSRDKIMPEFGDAAFKLKVGEVSAPVRTQFGYHLIKLLERKPAHTATLDEARDQITSYLQTAKRQKAVAQLIQGLRDKSKIAVFLPDIKA